MSFNFDWMEVVQNVIHNNIRSVSRTVYVAFLKGEPGRKILDINFPPLKLSLALTLASLILSRRDNFALYNSKAFHIYIRVCRSSHQVFIPKVLYIHHFERLGLLMSQQTFREKSPLLGIYLHTMHI